MGRAAGATGIISNIRARSRIRISGRTRSRPISSASSNCPPAPRSRFTARTRARYFQLALYRFENNTFVSVGGVSGPDIEPDAGATNPFRVGADRQTEARSFTGHIVAADPPSDPAQRETNTLYAGAKGGVVQAVLREYLSDIFIDGAGWGPSDAPAIGRGFPTYEATLADGTRLTQAEVAARVARPMAGATPPPITASQWEELVHSKDNAPALDPATAPARKDP